MATERQDIEQALTDRVVASFDAAPDDRLRDLLQSLTRHLHAFVRENRLTEAEWHTAIEFLTACGHITDDKRQEFILLSDVFGVSILAGIGFTVSLLIGELAFEYGTAHAGEVKIGVLAGSVVAGLLAAAVLLSRNRAYRRIHQLETVDTDHDGVPDVYGTREG